MLTLTPDEIRHLTGYQRAGDQLRELHKLGYVRAYLNRLGDVILDRSHYIAVCEGRYARPLETVPVSQWGAPMTERVVAENAPAWLLTPAKVRALPRYPFERPAHANPGIYFLWSGGGLAYVGMSVQIDYRLCQHLTAGRLPATHYSFVEVRAKDALEPVESYYIELMSPPCNIRRTGAHPFVQPYLQRALA